MTKTKKDPEEVYLAKRLAAIGKTLHYCKSTTSSTMAKKKKKR